ncbi:MAG: hypothetical protein CMI31_12365 [Opitutae bacterium]|nr:hypothetical protein [Opitutae bacterium]
MVSLELGGLAGAMKEFDDLKLIYDERLVTGDELRGRPHAARMTLEQLLPLLISPDSGKSLVKLDGHLTDGDNDYPVVEGLPVLYPAPVAEALLSGGVPLVYHEDAFQQYFLLNQIKQRGEINAAPSNLHYQRHLYRMSEFLQECRGTVLDVGCDDIEVSASLFPDNCQYVGLDPFSTKRSQFRIIGCGEFLPLHDDSIDNVVLNTSLDHILDFHKAIEEAHRVLKPGKFLWLCTLIWLKNAALQHDSVHFHHFRNYEIEGAFQEFDFKEVIRKEYSHKDETHRYGLYLCAQKTKG